jgi:hypothetical protein
MEDAKFRKSMGQEHIRKEKVGRDASLGSPSGLAGRFL